MPVSSSGAISLNDFHVEAGGTSGTNCSINDADIRGLISKASGVTMSFNEWYGATGQDLEFTFTAGTYGQGGKYPSNLRGVDTVGYAYSIGTWTDQNVGSPAKTITSFYSMTGGILPGSGIALTGNYNGQTLQSVLGYRYIKIGTTIVFDCYGASFGGGLGSAVGVYNSGISNTTRWINEYTNNTLVNNFPFVSGTSYTLTLSN